MGLAGNIGKVYTVGLNSFPSIEGERMDVVGDLSYGLWVLHLPPAGDLAWVLPAEVKQESPSITSPSLFLIPVLSYRDFQNTTFNFGRWPRGATPPRAQRKLLPPERHPWGIEHNSPFSEVRGWSPLQILMCSISSDFSGGTSDTYLVSAALTCFSWLLWERHTLLMPTVSSLSPVLEGLTGLDRVSGQAAAH